MARPIGKPMRAQLLPPMNQQEERLLAAAVLNRGMISSIDPADIPNEALSYAQGARVRFDRVSRRPGRAIFTPAKPNSNRVQRLWLDKPSRWQYLILRVASPTVHYLKQGAWFQLTGSLSGGANDPVFMANIVGSHLVVLANGVDRLKKIDMENEEIAELSSLAPRAKYVTGAFNRVVAASVSDTHEGMVTVAWSGDKNPTEWNAAVDISAGQSPIIDSPSDFADFITGIFGFDNVMIIPREHSIWLATKQPIAADPFNFFNAVPTVGCTLPNSIASVENGIAFVDTNTETVYHYRPGANPVDIGEGVKRDIMRDITDPSKMFAGDLESENEYIIGLPQSDGTTKVWVHNFKTRAWSFDVVPDTSEISAVAHLQALTGFVTYDELSGLYASYNALKLALDSYDDITPTPTPTKRLYFGLANGDILTEEAGIDTDNDVAYTFDIRSKEFQFPQEHTSVSRITFDYRATVSGTLNLLYSKDGGDTWTAAKSIITVANKRGLFKYKRAIRARRIMWRLTATDGLVEILSYDLRVIPGGEPDE
jgi:hypothetical protein